MREEPGPTGPSDDESTESHSALPRKSERIGPYKILEKLGEGGMGVVYLAEQESPIRRRVAVKLIKVGMDTKQVVARFEAERQALALMDHPNVATVFDAGSTADGRPYFVMEYVTGISITEHADKHRLTTRERVELFTTVCEGVQHAHQKGIIHRDIKPSNVLVALKDGKAVPKIIDFGVAKATAQHLTERTLFTELGAWIGTPDYMSPEQAELTAQDIDTRSDVYSLGVLLYELLVGALPFDPADLRRAGFDEMRRRIREDDPPKPSKRFSTLGNSSEALARWRQTNPPTLRRQLSGDLDSITMKALQKDPSRRYPTASELAADALRYLNNDPLEASSPPVLYRLRKFVRRNRSAVAGAIGILLILALVLAFTFKAASQKKFAEQQEEQAVLAQLASRTEFSEPDRRRAQTVVDRVSQRVLRGKPDVRDLSALAQAMLRVRLNVRSLQELGDADFGLEFGSTAYAKVKGVGIAFRPRLSMNGQPAFVDSSRIIVGLSDAGQDCGITLRQNISKSGRYVVTGNLEGRFVRSDISCTDLNASPDERLEFLSDPFLVPISEAAFSVVQGLPEDYPPAVRDSELAKAFESRVSVDSLRVYCGPSDVCRGVLTIRLPAPAMPVALSISLMHADDPEQVSLARLRVFPEPHFSVAEIGGTGFRVSPAPLAGHRVEVGIELDRQRLVPASTVTSTNARQIVFQSSSQVARTWSDIEYHLDFSFSKTVTVEFASAPIAF